MPLARCARPVLAAILLTIPPAVILGAPPVEPEVPVKDFSKATACKVVRVIDGDTNVVDLSGKETKVRLPCPPWECGRAGPPRPGTGRSPAPVGGLPVQQREMLLFL